MNKWLAPASAPVCQVLLGRQAITIYGKWNMIWVGDCLLFGDGNKNRSNRSGTLTHLNDHVS